MKLFESIEEARLILELGERATMKEIKDNYKRLISKWHPDKCRDKDEKLHHEMSQKLISAYNTIINYCENYEFSFSKEEIKNYLTGREWWMERFGNDPLWGRKE